MDKIKPCCGCMGDLAWPVFIRGHWVMSSMGQNFKDYVNGEAIGFVWGELLELDVADTGYRCPEFSSTYDVHDISVDKDHKQELAERWQRYLIASQFQFNTGC